MLLLLIGCFNRELCTIKNRYISQLVEINIVKTGHIKTKLIGIESPSVMGIDTTLTAKEMFRYPGVPLIRCQFILACENSELFHRNIGHNGVFSSTQGAVTTAEIFQTVLQFNFKGDTLTMATTGFYFHMDAIVLDLLYMLISNLIYFPEKR